MKIARLTSVMLVVCLLVSTFSFTAAAATATTEPGIMPMLNNTSAATTCMGITDAGKMEISYSVDGYPNRATKIVATTYIEKKTLGLFWTRVDLGTTNNELVTTVNDYRYNGTRTLWMESSGTYRATVTYEVYGTGGSADVITHQRTASY